MSNEQDEAIAVYRAQLCSEAELAERDLDEIEDHLRTLTEHLRDTGMPAAEAVAEAARRLGEPRVLAREACRVRSVWGARLSTMRTWSVLALLVPLLGLSAYQTYPYTGLWSRSMLELVAVGVLALALALRLGWARPLLLGGLGFYLIPTLLVGAMNPDESPVWLAWHLGMLAFLVPWRRGEVTASGFALAGYVWAYGAAAFTFGFQVTTPQGSVFEVTGPNLVAIVAIVIAATGAILRARWSSVAGLAVAAMLCITSIQLVGVIVRFHHPTVMMFTIVGCAVTGAVAMTVGSLLAWRNARSTFGSLRAIRS